MSNDMDDLTLEEKAQVLVNYGLADDLDEAFEMLEDMGETDDDE